METTAYNITITPDAKGRYLISENGQPIARAFSQPNAKRIARALVDADIVETRIAMLEREPVTGSLADRIRRAFLGGK